jgi:hypothetical protein
MTKGGITFKAKNLDGDEVHELDRTADFIVILYNGTSSTTYEFPGSIDCFKGVGHSLKQFLSNKDDVIHFSANGWKRDMSLKVFCFDINGASCIQVTIENYASIPAKCKLEFYIAADPVEINQLGELLHDWDPTLSDEICWKGF